MMLWLSMLLAVILDRLLGETSRCHPLVGFGHVASWIEAHLYADRRSAGVVAWVLAVVPCVVVFTLIARALATWSPWLSASFGALLLYVAIGQRSMEEHALLVRDRLRANDLPGARQTVGRIVSRDTETLDATKVATAATESVLENGNDAVFGALFWFVALGVPGVVAYRLVNTLDAMWGYRTPRFARFGWAAARMDDVFNYIPARLTALTYAVFGDAACAWHCWHRQARHWDSPNAGPVMAAGAGSLRVLLGGAMPYHGVRLKRLRLGVGPRPDAETIDRALRLLRHGVYLWLAVIAVVVVAIRLLPM